MVQQLDKNMSNLRTWLSRIEGELTKPIVFGVCHGDEIQCKLAEQQVHTVYLLPPVTSRVYSDKYDARPSLISNCPGTAEGHRAAHGGRGVSAHDV